MVLFVLSDRAAFSDSAENHSSAPDFSSLSELDRAIRQATIQRNILHGVDPATIKATWPPEYVEIMIEMTQARAVRDAEERTRREAKINSYILAEDFPENKIEVFHNFILYSARSEIVDARLGLSDKISYADFLSAVSFALSMQRNYDETHAPSFLEKILEPLRHDLTTKEFRGYRFPVEDLTVFFQEYAAYVQHTLARFSRGLVGYWMRIPHEFHMASHYARTFWAIYEGRLLEAYNQFLSCGTHSPGSLGNRRRFERPYYAHSDEERHKWFLFLQAELRYAGHGAFADQIIEVELDHYRELIVWQLQKRAYLAQRLYEDKVNANLSTLKSLLEQELTNLRSNDPFNLIFEKALDSLRAIDDKVRGELVQGIIVLPWINRQAIDRRMGRRMPSERREIHHAQLNTPPVENGSIVDDEAQKVMQETYNWILCYIRALAIISERLYTERSLIEMTQLHSTLVNNWRVSHTEIDRHLFHRSFVVEERRNFVIEEQRGFNNRRLYIITRHFWPRQHRRQYGDMTVGNIILPWVEVRNGWFLCGRCGKIVLVFG